MALHIEWRVEEYPDGPVQLSMGCGEGCGSAMDVTSILAQAPEGEWATTEIPLACFKNGGLNASEVAMPFSLTSSSKGRITLHAVSISKASQKLEACPQ